MGMIVKFGTLGSEQEVFRLRIFCSKHQETLENAISINRLLAEKLLQVKPNRRTMRIEKFFNEVLDALPPKTVIKDIDVMFNPEYKVDVLRILVEANKRNPFALVWPGLCDGTRLLYGEEGFEDYKSYDISDYDIVCVV